MNTASTLEILEHRIALAGIVTVTYSPVTGELTLAGDTFDNAASVFQTGLGTYRIEATAGTLLDPGGLATMDIAKLTKLSISAGNGADTFALTNLRTLTDLSYSSDGARGHTDRLKSTNISVHGSVNIVGGRDFDYVTFEGLSTVITGNVNITDNRDIEVDFEAQKTTVGGTIHLTNAAGSGDTAGEFLGLGTGTYARGVKVTVPSGGVHMFTRAGGPISIGKLPTGESILVSGGDGDNVVLLAADLTLAGGIRVTGGLGEDQVAVDHPAGTVKIGALASGKSIEFDGRAGDDALKFTAASLSLAGGIDFLGGDGANSITFDAPNGRAAIGKLRTGESIKFTGGADADTLSASVASLTLAGAIDFAAGDGENSILLDAPSGVVSIGKLSTGQSLRYAGGSGNDSVVTALSRLTTAGGIESTGGAGANSLEFLGKVREVGPLEDTSGAITLGKLLSGESLRYTGGSDGDSILINQASVVMTGGVNFTDAAGQNSVDIFGRQSLRIGALAAGASIRFLGDAGVDRLVLRGGGIALKGSLEMSGGDGNQLILMAATTASIGKSAAGASIRFTGGGGVDSVEVDGAASLAGSLIFDGGAGNDALNLTGLTTFKAMGAVSFLGGSGADTFDLKALALTLGSTLTVTGGDDTDTVAIDADGSIAGVVNLDLGGATAGHQSATLTSRFGLPAALALKSSLTVTATGDAASTDGLTLTNVAVAKAVTASLGAGVSTVTIDNLRASSTLTLHTNDGADIVKIERANFFGNSTIAKLATILAGAGDDQVLIGNPLPAPNGGLADSTRARFLGGLSADGGVADNDTANDIAGENDFPLGAPTLAGFESAVV